MKTTRRKETTAKNYELLSPEDRKVILSYKEKVETGEYTEKLKRSTIADNIAGHLSKDTDIPLRKWDTDIAETFLRQPGWTPNYRKLALTVLSEILKEAGNPTDLSTINPKELVLASSFILTYRHLDEIVREGISKDEILKEKPWETSANSSAIAAIYLSWIGLSVNDIVTLPSSSVHIRERAVCLGDKVYSYHEFPEISEFMKSYSEAEYFLTLSQNGEKKYPFIDSPFFIKQFKQGGISKSRLIKKVKAFSDQTLGNIYHSGRLNKIFRYEQDGMKAERSNYKELAQLLNIDNPDGAYTSINLILSDYAEYKKLRTKTLQGKEQI